MSRIARIADDVSKAAMTRLAAASVSPDSNGKEVQNENGDASGTAHFQHNRPRA